MPRPQRIEYENAFYHVMNRGRGRQFIFHDNRYNQAFLTTLGEAKKRFDCIIHAYCLMSNHYHLLIETPKANLGRIMRHINGVYTQRYNKLKCTDGPLFRGRYKAILVEKDEYLLQLSRYIHRNPIDMKTPLVNDLADYIWSSYPAFTNKTKAPDWLETNHTYDMLSHRHKYKQYKLFVLQGNASELVEFYNKGNTAAVLASPDFKIWVYETLLQGLPSSENTRLRQPNLTLSITMEEVVRGVAAFYDCKESVITRVIKGPNKGFSGRKLAMYFCQELLDAKLIEIAAYFNLSHGGSVSFITHQVRKKMADDRGFAKELDAIFKSIVKKAT